MLREVAFIALLLTPGAVAADGCAPVAGAEPVRIASLNKAGEIVTEAGERLRLAAMATPPEMSVGLLERLSTTWAGATVTVRRLSAGPDRWGRTPALVFAPASLETLPPLLLNVVALAEGVALADPGEAPPECRQAISAAEASARRRRAGLWQDPSRHVVSGLPTSEEAHAHAGQFRIVEGQVRHVTERRSQVFIDLGPYGSLAPSLRTARRNIAHILPSGMTLTELKGRNLRVRGVMETSGERLWMTLDRASFIEVLN